MSPTKSINYLFVYGTLKKDQLNNDLLNGIFISNVQTTENFKMYSSGGSIDYPCLVKDNSGCKIQGELYLVGDLKELDEYEDVPHLFKREYVIIDDVGSMKFSELRVQAYLYNQPTGKLKLINDNKFKGIQ